ncbi:MAG: hypothetical protein IJX17_08055 [Clostridia bacterium]|nr:hypothetical protein [Clostridia bacterium]
MAKEKKSSYNLMDMCSFIAVCLGGIALFAAMLLGKLGVSVELVGLVQKIANIVGWAVLCLLSFNVIKSRKAIWMWIVWVIAVVMIVIGIIL